MLPRRPDEKGVSGSIRTPGYVPGAVRQSSEGTVSRLPASPMEAVPAHYATSATARSRLSAEVNCAMIVRSA
jgi:hypothetical protein